MRLEQIPYLLIAVMAITIAAVAGISIWLLYEVSFEQQRSRLIEVAQSRARMIEAVAAFDAVQSQDAHPEGAVAATLSQVTEAHSRFRGFGESGEFLLGKREGNRIVFLLRHRHTEMDAQRSVSVHSDAVVPMRNALLGQSGTVVALDYRGVLVLAAHEPVQGTGWGVVAKIDVDEVRRPFIQAGLNAVLAALVMIVLGAGLFLQIVQPLIERLQKSRQYNRMLFERSPIGLALCKMDGELVDVNPAYAAIIGRTVEEAKRLSYWQITPEKYAADEQAHLDSLKQTGRYGPYEKEYIHKNGHWVPVQLSGQILERNGEPFIWSSVEDISERVRNEARLRQAATVFDNASEGIVITDAENRIVMVNKAYTEITGYSAGKVIGKDPGFHKSGRHDVSFYQKLWEALNGEGRWQGEFWNRRRNGEIYPAWQSIAVIRDEQGRAANYVSVFSDISIIKANEERLAHMAHHDVLTGLPNRLLFFANLEQALAHAKRYRHKVGVLFLDLDRFKLINDGMGHAAGDRLLQVIGERLKGCVRAEDTVSRMGGDEFIILLAEMAHAEDARLIAHKVIEAVRQPVAAEEGRQLLTSTSIGVSVYPDDADSAEGLVKAADAAMYQAKEQGRNNVQFYAADMR